MKKLWAWSWKIGQNYCAKTCQQSSQPFSPTSEGSNTTKNPITSSWNRSWRTAWGASNMSMISITTGRSRRRAWTNSNSPEATPLETVVLGSSDQLLRNYSYYLLIMTTKHFPNHLPIYSFFIDSIMFLITFPFSPKLGSNLPSSSES